MKFNPFTKAETLTDEALDAIAQNAEGTRAALVEREKRAEARRQAEAEEALAALAEKRRVEIAEVTKRRETIGAALREATLSLDAAIIAAGAELEKRDGFLRAGWQTEAETKALGASAPSLSVPPFTPSACEAARRLSPVIEREFFVDPLANLRAEHPRAFSR